ncbi:hypothetical protein GMRT_12577 [Giardia muris]|uniref:Uncharacterized protein n=1 Tax=Giardia muris TaxID=5742 RepID=A0A4Z1STY8_GIAMU|nr:hypothetical protein GMRT_12577 [Giardia muris]|eukprot:TNJ28445.1 hypothetical protein GMRT_12577 [Giardia muris]
MPPKAIASRSQTQTQSQPQYQSQDPSPPPPPPPPGLALPPMLPNPPLSSTTTLPPPSAIAPNQAQIHPSPTPDLYPERSMLNPPSLLSAQYITDSILGKSLGPASTDFTHPSTGIHPMILPSTTTSVPTGPTSASQIPQPPIYPQSVIPSSLPKIHPNQPNIPVPYDAAEMPSTTMVSSSFQSTQQSPASPQPLSRQPLHRSMAPTVLPVQQPQSSMHLRPASHSQSHQSQSHQSMKTSRTIKHVEPSSQVVLPAERYQVDSVDNERFKKVREGYLSRVSHAVDSLVSTIDSAPTHYTCVFPDELIQHLMGLTSEKRNVGQIRVVGLTVQYILSSMFEKAAELMQQQNLTCLTDELLTQVIKQLGYPYCEADN